MFWGKNTGDVVGPVSPHSGLWFCYPLHDNSSSFVFTCVIFDSLHYLLTILIFKVKLKISYFQMPIKPKELFSSQF